MSGGKSPIKLLKFFVYNSTLGPGEGEQEKKILYYYPDKTDADTKMRDVGLCEGIARFTQTFSDSDDCDSLHTQKTRQLFLQPEVNFWMVLVVGVPFSQKMKDQQAFTEYHEEDIQDSVFKVLLRQSYEMFRLFMGTFSDIMRKKDKEHLQQRLEHFYSRYLLTLKLSQADLLDVFGGIHFLPLDKNMYLKIQCFINLIEETFSQIKYTAFLYNDQLVWSGLEQDDMRVMYKYLTTSLFPTCMESELQAGQNQSMPASSTGNTQPLSNSHYAKFLTGPSSLTDTSLPVKIPRIYVNAGTDRMSECHLLVYRALSATVCLMVDAKFQMTFDFFRSLDTFIGPHLTVLASDIGEQYQRRAGQSGTTEFKYIYFNHMNLAAKSTVHADMNKKTTHIPPDITKLLNDINADMSGNEEDSEMILKTASDCWVVGKKCDQREFYVVISQKNANLIEINEEVKRLCQQHFNNIFFLD